MRSKTEVEEKKGTKKHERRNRREKGKK